MFQKLEKKLASINSNLITLNEQQAKIEQSLAFIIPDFPEIVFEMEQTMSKEVSNTVSPIMTSEEKLKMFALQNSILLTNTSISDYINRETLHTGLSVVYKATKNNNQVVILKDQF